MTKGVEAIQERKRFCKSEGFMKDKILSIGGLSLPIPCVLAPISGVSDLPFRMINRLFGAPFAFAEMIDAKALSILDRRTRDMMLSGSGDRPLGIQLLAGNSYDAARALETLNCFEYDLLDFNAACPAPKVVRKGKGAALLRDPQKLGEILKTLVRESPVPVTVKIRSGWDSGSVNAREVSLHAEDAGISGLFIHGRTRVQGYSGTVNYTTIKNVKAAVRVPVIASGDNLDVVRVQRMFDVTDCDGVAIARGSFGNPWIFRDLNCFFLDGSPGEDPGVWARLAVMKHHLNLLVCHYGEDRGLSVFRKFFIWYTKGIRRSRVLRDRAFRAGELKEMYALIDEVARFADSIPVCKERREVNGETVS